MKLSIRIARLKRLVSRRHAYDNVYVLFRFAAMYWEIDDRKWLSIFNHLPRKSVAHWVFVKRRRLYGLDKNRSL